ncbi:GNAT family N-acetyltransferase [Janibacter indicus]|nr:GNAT family N-acetyltransferase [Janibacter indicus]
MTGADLPFVVETCQDPESARWTTVPRPYDLADAEEFLQAHADGWAEPRGRRHWAIEVRPDDEGGGLPFVGVVDLRPGARAAPDGSVGPAIHWERLA